MDDLGVPQETYEKNGWFRGTFIPRVLVPFVEAEVTKLKPRIAKVSLDPRKRSQWNKQQPASMETVGMYIKFIGIRYILTRATWDS